MEVTDDVGPETLAGYSWTCETEWGCGGKYKPPLLPAKPPFNAPQKKKKERRKRKEKER
jgi:hypothetical protein